MSFWYSKRVVALNADLFTSMTPGPAFDSPWRSRPGCSSLSQADDGHTGRSLMAHARQAHRTDSSRHSSARLYALVLCASQIAATTRLRRGPPYALIAVPSMIDLDLAMGEGGALQDGEVKHNGADGACTSGNIWAGYVL